VSPCFFTTCHTCDRAHTDVAFVLATKSLVDEEALGPAEQASTALLRASAHSAAALRLRGVSSSSRTH
jgi:hypothetical protein